VSSTVDTTAEGSEPNHPGDHRRPTGQRSAGSITWTRCGRSSRPASWAPTRARLRPGASIYVGASLLLLHVTREAFLFVSACMLTYSYRTLTKGTGPASTAGGSSRSGCVSLLDGHLLLHDVPQGGIDAGRQRRPPRVSGGLGLLPALLPARSSCSSTCCSRCSLALLRRTARHGRILLVGAVFQVTLVMLIHWGVTPGFMQNFWATREVTSYTFYLVAGAIVALHLEEFHDWLLRHARSVVCCTLVAAGLAEVWFVLATRHVVGGLGPAADPFQPNRHPVQYRCDCLRLPGRRLPGRPAALGASRCHRAFGIGQLLRRVSQPDVFITLLGRSAGAGSPTSSPGRS